MPSCKLLVPMVVLVAAMLAGGPRPLRAQQADAAAALLEQAIRRQRIDGDLAGAIAGFQAVLARFGGQRAVASEALWRLAQSQEQLGRFDDARRSYDRLLSEYPDNLALTNATRARLAALAEDEAWTDPEFSPEVTVVDEWAPTSSETPRQGGLQFSVFSDLSIHFRSTGQTHRLMTSARSAAYPVVSPDNRRVAFLSWNGDLQENAQRSMAGTALRQQGVELRVTSIDGTEDRVILQGTSLRWLRPFEWSPDGRSILTLIERTSGVRQVALVEVSDGSVSVLKALPWLAAREMAFSADGQFAAYRSSEPRSASQFEFYILPTSEGPGAIAERRYALSLVGQRQSRVPEAELAAHVLNRIGFGPRRGDIERVLSMGVDAYIDQQLHPERIEDPVVDRMIGGFTSLRMGVEELLEKAGPAHPIAGRRRASIFERPGIIARARVGEGAAFPGMSAGGPPAGLDERPRDLEAHGARMIRAIHGQRQLQEVLVDFWMNHFSINHDGDDQLIPAFEEHVIRRHALGNFEDLLKAVATHPRMLSYLDNWRSSAPAEVIAERLAALKKSAGADEKVALLEREVFLKETKGLNENYARELLELHTMGVDSGYTQQDIQEVARILTGWTIRTSGVVNGRDEDGVFMFDPLMHVEGDKVVLGHTFTSGGIDEGEALLTMLAHRPETARFIATKLARRFIADDPPPGVIAAASRTFLDTRGDIRAVVRTILMSPEFRSSEALRVKIKKPFELVVSALRAVDATFDDPDVYLSFSGNRSFIERMGERMYNHEAPDGNPDVGAEWMNANALLVRLEFAHRLATGRLTGIKADVRSAEALLTELGVPRPTASQIEQTRAMMAATAATTAPDSDGGVAMGMGATAGASSDGGTADSAAIVVAAMLGSPQFQKR